MVDYPVHIEIEPRVHLVRGANRARFPEANSLIIDDDILTLVDAGSSREHIEKTLKDLGHVLDDLDRIVLTHFHIDHKGHAAFLQKISRCEVLCHPFAEKGVRTFMGMAEYYGIKSHRFYNTWKSFLGQKLPHVEADYEVSGYFEDGETIDCGNVELVSLHTPGHTLDHTCFGINGTKTILLVDIDLTRFGPWYGNAVSDINQFRVSIKRIIELEPKIGISSHLLNPVTEDLHQRLVTYLKVFDDRERIILRGIEAGYDTIDKLVMLPTIYPRIPYEVYYVFEEFMLQKHVELLVNDGRVIMDANRLCVSKA